MVSNKILISCSVLWAVLGINFITVLIKYLLGKKLSQFDIFSVGIIFPPAYAILWAMSLKRSIESEGEHHG